MINKMKYYNQISSNDYRSAKNNCITFNISDLEIIRKRVEYYNTFDTYVIEYSSSKNPPYGFRKFIYPGDTRLVRIELSYSSGFYAYIYKNDDYWYYVAARRREDIAERLYKCDQVDGLIQLMDYVFKEVYN